MTQRYEQHNDRSSNEVYDHTCQICVDLGEKEAVRFCTTCAMYMCQTCCDLHKKIPLAIYHKVLGKEKFGDIHTVKGLFEKRLIPTLTTQCPDKCENIYQYNYENAHYSKCEILHVLNIPYSDSMLCFLYQKNINYAVHAYNIGTIDYTRGYDRKCSGVVDNSNNVKNWCTCENISYMTLPRTNKVIKYCCKHNNADIAFELPAGNQCYGITLFNNGLAIAVNIDIEFDLPNWKIQHVKQDGKLIKEICYGDDGKQLFDIIRSLASNTLQDVLFVAAAQCIKTSKDSVLALDKNGTLLFKYAVPADCGFLYGLTCDTDGNLYLSTGWKVIQIDKHGKKSRELMKFKKDIKLVTICFNTMLKQLVVADINCKITYFNFV